MEGSGVDELRWSNAAGDMVGEGVGWCFSSSVVVVRLEEVVEADSVLAVFNSGREVRTDVPRDVLVAILGVEISEN